MPPLNVLCFYKRPITLSKISGLYPKSNSTCVLILYINIPNLNWIDAVFQKLLSGHHILITDGRTHGRTHRQTGVTLNAPSPFFEWRGHKKAVQKGEEFGEIEELYIFEKKSLMRMFDIFQLFAVNPTGIGEWSYPEIMFNPLWATYQFKNVKNCLPFSNKFCLYFTIRFVYNRFSFVGPWKVPREIEQMGPHISCLPFSVPSRSGQRSRQVGTRPVPVASCRKWSLCPWPTGAAGSSAGKSWGQAR